MIGCFFHQEKCSTTLKVKLFTLIYPHNRLSLGLQLCYTHAGANNFLCLAVVVLSAAGYSPAVDEDVDRMDKRQQTKQSQSNVHLQHIRSTEVRLSDASHSLTLLFRFTCTQTAFLEEFTDHHLTCQCSSEYIHVSSTRIWYLLSGSFVLGTYIEGVTLQWSFNQSKTRVLQQRDNSRYGHHHTIQLPKVAGWKTKRETQVFISTGMSMTSCPPF